jgi:DNA-binding transcriptional MocR family regulator
VTSPATRAIDFGNGQPSLSLLPTAAVRTATEDCLARGDASLLQYGENQGDAAFRASLAAFLTRRYAWSVQAEHLMVTTGASQALDLVCTRFTKPGDTIFVEEPTYFLALEVFRDHGLQVVGIPIDDEGLRTDALEDALTRHTPILLYTVPSFQNPTGTTLSATRREALIAISRAHDLLIVADEVYHLLDFGAAPPRPLASYAESARVLSFGSFSKICAPGLRLGWIHSAPDLLGTLRRSGLVQSGGGLTPFTSGVVRSVLDLGLADTTLDALRAVYAERSAVLCGALRERLPTATFVEPRGGYFVWVELPQTVDALEVHRLALSHDISLAPGHLFSADRRYRHHLRLNFGHPDNPHIEQALHTIGQIAKVLA